MSELGNILRQQRGPRSQKEIAKGADLGERTVIRAESGEKTSLETVRALSRYYGLTRAEHAALIVAWLRLELGDEFALLNIRSAVPGKVKLTDADKFIETFRSVPRHLQRELSRALEHGEVLAAIAPLNDLVERLKTKVAEGEPAV